MKVIQKALRPQGFDSEPLAGAPSPKPSSSPGTFQCTNTRPIWPGRSVGDFPAAIQSAFVDAARKFNIPTCVLSGIASVEGSRMTLLTDAEANAITRNWSATPEQEIPESQYPGLLKKINCSANSAGAVGPMQVTIDSWTAYQNASGSNAPSRCNARDAIFATAMFLTQGRLPIYGYPSGSNWSDPRKFCAAGQTNYGSCRLDAPTCNNLGTNYCDFILNYCKNNDPRDNIAKAAKCSDYSDMNADSK